MMHAYRYERTTRCYTILGDLPLGVVNTEDVVLLTQTQTSEFIHLVLEGLWGSGMFDRVVSIPLLRIGM